MRFWFDTEFYEDGRTIKLISIGVVAEDGAQYYAETAGAYVLSGATEWLAEHVRPSLTPPWAGSAVVKTPRTIASDLIAFMGDKPEIWAYYADYDWVVLCQLFGIMINLPKGWPRYCRDVKQLCDSLGNPELPRQDPTKKHQALEDAIWTRQAWEFLQKPKMSLLSEEMGIS